MPIYEYYCLECADRSEELQRINADPLTECKKCGGELKKLISAPSFQFKGTGWYVTDYAKKDGSKGSGDSEKAAKSDSSTDSKSKSDSKAESSSKKSDSQAKESSA